MCLSDRALRQLSRAKDALASLQRKLGCEPTLAQLADRSGVARDQLANLITADRAPRGLDGIPYGMVGGMPVLPDAPDPMVVHPVAGQPRVVFLRPLVEHPAVEVGDYTYYDHPTRAEHFVEDAVLYAVGPERLIIGRFCALGAGVRFLLPGANHADRGPSTFPFGIFGSPWDSTMDLVLSAASRGDTVVGSDVWLGYQALVLPGVTIGHGAVVAAASVVTSDVPPYAVVAGNPARVVRRRFDDDDVKCLLRAAWWDWPPARITEHARAIMAGTPAELEQIAHDRGSLPE